MKKGTTYEVKKLMLQPILVARWELQNSQNNDIK
jgi:hypothetical protein